MAEKLALLRQELALKKIETENLVSFKANKEQEIADKLREQAFFHKLLAKNRETYYNSR